MSIVPFLIHGRFFEEEEKRPYEKVYEATTGGEGESRMTDYETKYKNLVALIQRELDIYEVLEGKVQEQVCILRDFHRNVRRIIKGEQHD